MHAPIPEFWGSYSFELVISYTFISGTSLQALRDKNTYLYVFTEWREIFIHATADHSLGHFGHYLDYRCILWEKGLLNYWCSFIATSSNDSNIGTVDFGYCCKEQWERRDGRPPTPETGKRETGERGSREREEAGVCFWCSRPRSLLPAPVGRRAAGGAVCLDRTIYSSKRNKHTNGRR